MAEAIPQAGSACPRCQAPNYKGSLFCDNCRVYFRDDTQAVERTTYNRRFWGDVMLEGLLFIVTLGIGWFIWLIFTSKTGQTPAKRILNVYPVNVETGRVIGQGETWVREIVVKWLAVGVINSLTGGVAGVLDAIWIFFDKDRQTLHDKVLKQIVVYAPAGVPSAMQQMQGAPPLYQAPALIPGQAPPTPPPTTQDIGEELRELNRLKTEGLITDEEFEQKRQSLIGKM